MDNHKVFSKDIINGLETDLIKLIYYDYERDERDSYTTHECNRLCRVLEGEKKIKVNNESTLIYSDDEFVLLKPKSKVEVVTDKPTKALVLEISNDLVSYINNKVIYEFKENIDYDLKNNCIFKDFNVKNLMDDVIDIAASGENNKEFLIDLRAQEIAYEGKRNVEISKCYRSRIFSWI